MRKLAYSLQALFARWTFIDIFFREKQLPKKIIGPTGVYTDLFWQTNKVVWLVNNVCYFKRILFSNVTSEQTHVSVAYTAEKSTGVGQVL